MRKILYRFDANNKIGFGHFTRCCQLAKEFKKKKIQNILYGKVENIDNLYLKRYFSKIINPKIFDETQDIFNTIRIYKRLKCDFLILDNISLSDKKKKFFENSNIKRFEFIKNISSNNLPTHGICSIPYKNVKKNFSKKIFVGKDYAVLRDQFYNKKKTKSKNYILITTGGGNDKGATISILKKTVSLLGDTKIFLLIGHNNNLLKIKKWISNNNLKKKIKLLIKKKNIVNYIDQSLFAICAGGVISHEIDSRSKRMMIFSITKNQILQSKNWANFGHYYLGDFNKIKYRIFKNVFSKFKKLKQKNFKLRKKNYLKVVEGILKEFS